MTEPDARLASGETIIMDRRRLESYIQHQLRKNENLKTQICRWENEARHESKAFREESAALREERNKLREELSVTQDERYRLRGECDDLVAKCHRLEKEQDESRRERYEIQEKSWEHEKRRFDLNIQAGALGDCILFLADKIESAVHDLEKIVETGRDADSVRRDVGQVATPLKNMLENNNWSHYSLVNLDCIRVGTDATPRSRDETINDVGNGSPSYKHHALHPSYPKICSPVPQMERSLFASVE